MADNVIDRFASLPSFLNSYCGENNWKFISSGAFGKVYQCGNNRALKLQNVNSRQELQDIQKENQVPTLILETCEKDSVICNVLPVTQEKLFYVEDQKKYFAMSQMSFVKGGTGGYFLKNENYKLWRINSFLENCEALFHSIDEMHKSGWVHRDIKPDNLLLEIRQKSRVLKPDFKLYLADYGLACQMSTGQLFSCKGLAGTIIFMDPVVLLSMNNVVFPSIVFNPAVDIYALGLTLFEMLTGQQYHSNNVYKSYKKLEKHQVDPQMVARLLEIEWYVKNAVLTERANEMMQTQGQYLGEVERNLFISVINAMIRMTYPLSQQWRPTSSDLVKIFQI